VCVGVVCVCMFVCVIEVMSHDSIVRASGGNGVCGGGGVVCMCVCVCVCD
jgi:hypothetical protein